MNKWRKERIKAENKKWHKERLKAIKKAIFDATLELRHYRHLLRGKEHKLNECPLLK